MCACQLDVNRHYPLVFRPATLEDAQLLYDWRNDSETRRNSRYSVIIAWNEHEQWLSRALVSPDLILRIIEEASTPVGVVRADRVPDGWELSWTVAPEARGRGIGKRMVASFVTLFKGRAIAKIRIGHMSSAKVAAAAGLVQTGSVDDKGFQRWVRE